MITAIVVGLLIAAAVHIIFFRTDQFEDYRLSAGYPIQKRREKPECFGDYPFISGQTSTERGCADCAFAQDCYEYSPPPMGYCK